MKRMTAMVVRFRRESGGTDETGIGILTNDNLMTIVDANGQCVLEPVWRYDLRPHLGCMIVPTEQL